MSGTESHKQIFLSFDWGILLLTGLTRKELPGRSILEQLRHHRILIAVPEKSLRVGASIGKNVLVYKTALKLAPLMEILERIRTENTTTVKSTS